MHPDLNPASTSLTVETKGVFKGSFKLSDTDPRAAFSTKTVARTGNYIGVIINNSGEIQGFGSFLLPQLPSDTPATTPTSSPILSGFVDFHKP
jgi:hypothetical protein